MQQINLSRKSFPQNLDNGQVKADNSNRFLQNVITYDTKLVPLQSQHSPAFFFKTMLHVLVFFPPVQMWMSVRLELTTVTCTPPVATSLGASSAAAERAGQETALNVWVSAKQIYITSNKNLLEPYIASWQSEPQTNNIYQYIMLTMSFYSVFVMHIYINILIKTTEHLIMN